MQDMTTDTTTERWAYAGRCILTGRKTGHEFVTEGGSGESFYFAKAPKNPVVGGVYTVEVERHEDGVTVVGLTQSFWTGEYVEDYKRDKWRADDRQAAAELDHDKAARAAAKDNGDLGDLTLRQVRDMLRTAIGTRRVSLLAVVLRYLGV